MSEPAPASEQTTPQEEDLHRRRRRAHLLAYSVGSVGAVAVGSWLLERFLNAQYSAPSDGRLSAFFNQVTSDLLQVGLPVVLGVLTIAFSGVLVTQFSKGVFRRYLGVPSPEPPAFSFEGFPVEYTERLAVRHELRAAVDDVVRNDVDPAQEVVQLRRKLRRYQRDNAALEAKIEEASTVRGLFVQMCTRLSYERSRLSANSRTNLLIGIIASLLALGVLGLPLVSPDVIAGGERVTETSFWRQYATRLPVGLLLQFVAFFFLRLYVSCEMDIKSNKNEITNIEARYLAYLMSQEDVDVRASSVISNLAETERNFVLKRGERTIGTENDSRYNDLKEMMDRILEALIGRATDAPQPGR